MKALAQFSVMAFSCALFFTLIPSGSATAQTGPVKVSFRKEADKLHILIGDRDCATYAFDDPNIPRPYFCQVKTLNSVQVTRIHPPDPVINKGNDDHETFHPGMWLAFGDIDGNDYWRNKARVRHVKFIGPFQEDAGMGRFTVLNQYEKAGSQGAPVCEETCTYTIQVDSGGYFFLARSEFHSDGADFTFGDQEEMGFGVRVNTPLTVKFGGGGILNSDGGQNEKGTWGKIAKWCAATGTVDGKPVTVAIIPAPDNFRPSWFHSRDYGLIVANPFGRKAMTGPEDSAMPPDATVVKRGEVMKLGFGVWVSDSKPDLVSAPQGAYSKCLELMGGK